jgi:hypothetical protein
MRSGNELRIKILERQNEKMNCQNRSETEKNDQIVLIQNFVGRSVSGFDDLSLEELKKLEQFLIETEIGSKT